MLTPLPEPDPTRPHVFMDITVDNKPAGGARTTTRSTPSSSTAVVLDVRQQQLQRGASTHSSSTSSNPLLLPFPPVSLPLHPLHLPAGRLVIELFEDVAPAAARHLLNRCTPGAGASLQGTLFHKLLAGFGLFGGKRWVVSERGFWEACDCGVWLSHGCWHSAHSQWWLTRTACWCRHAQQHTSGCHCCFCLLAPALTPLLLFVFTCAQLCSAVPRRPAGAQQQQVEDHDRGCGVCGTRRSRLCDITQPGTQAG